MAAIQLIKVYLIHQKQFRIMPVQLPIPLHLHPKVASFIVCVPVKTVNPCITTLKTYIDLGSKFYFSLGLSPYYWPHMWLMDAHYPVRATVGPVPEHTFLLFQNMLHDKEILKLVLVKEGCYRYQIHLMYLLGIWLLFPILSLSAHLSLLQKHSDPTFYVCAPATRGPLPASC